MIQGVKNLFSSKYVGRIILLGKDKSDKNIVIIYAITGRSLSSQARKMELKENTIYIRPTDQKIIDKGNKDLLVYPALFIQEGIAVSNGRQTGDIKKNLKKINNPTVVLASALKNWDYEPDAPNFTPRISGCVLSPQRGVLSIIKRDGDGSSQKNYFEFPLKKGTGKMISTYWGRNSTPLPSFKGEPVEVRLNQKSVQETAEEFYKALGPSSGGKDYRVALACAFCQDLLSSQFEIHIINRCERMRE